MFRYLLLEDNETDIDLISREIYKKWPNTDLVVAKRIADAKAALQGHTKFDAAIFDIRLPDGSGLDLLNELRNQNISLPIIILTGTGSEEIAIAALKAGANDYISKTYGFHKIVPAQLEFTLSQSLASRQNLSVIYVEHHTSDIDLTKHYLNKHAPHIQLTSVSSGEELMNMLPLNGTTACEFDVLMIDYRLPGLNALELSKKIRQERDLSIAIVIVTGQGDEKIAAEALKLGVDDYLVKRENYLLRLPSVLMSAHRKRELDRQRQVLRKSELKYRLLADYASDWEYWINPEGEYIYISPSCEKTSGYPTQSFIENKLLLEEITRSDFRNEVAEHFRKKIEGPHEPMEFPILTAKGDERWISHTCQSVYDDYGKYLGKRGVNRDITTSKKVEDNLRQSEERFKRLFEDLGDAVFVTQIGGKAMGNILEVNSAAIKQSGYSRKELLKMNIIRDLAVTGSGTEVSSEDSDRDLLSGKSVSYTEKKRRKNGEEYWSEIIITPIEYNGKTAGLSINRDITDRKRAELIQEVILTISNATSAANDLEDAMKIIQKELGRLIDTENFFLALYDKETDNIHLPYFQDEKDDVSDFPAGKTLTGLVIKSGKSMLIDDSTTKLMEVENKIEKVGFDSAIWLGVPLKIKGIVTGAFVVQSYTNPKAYTEKDKEVLEIISHQISISIERKREEEKLLKALEAAKESDEMKTAFLANMSHELRTPLNAVIGFSDLIDVKTPAEDSAAFAELIYKSGVNLLAIVDDIFEVTMIERGQVMINRSKKPLTIFLNDIYQTILHRQKNLRQTGIIIEQETEGIDHLTDAFTDFTKLKQVFISILSNALKFTAEGSIRFGVFPSKDGKEFVFYVKDTGVGIEKEKHQMIFERFQIGDNTRTRKYSGVGVGLYISKKLVNLLGGEIWLESEEGKGSEFYFSIPK